MNVWHKVTLVIWYVFAVYITLITRAHFRTNLTASGPRPNPQGSYHYGMINTTRTIIVANSAGQVNGKQRYGVNSVSFVAPDTPMKLADYFKIQGVFKENSISDRPYGGGLYLDTSVLTLPYSCLLYTSDAADE